MITRRQQLRDVFQTGREMRRLVCSYWGDLGRWLDVPFSYFYRHVCLLPYVSDPEQIETVSRPLYLLNEDYKPRDCDDKAVLCASQPSGELNHVFTQLENGLDIDATYREYVNYMGHYPYYPQVTNRENLTGFF